MMIVSEEELNVIGYAAEKGVLVQQKVDADCRESRDHQPPPTPSERIFGRIAVAGNPKL